MEKVEKLLESSDHSIHTLTHSCSRCSFRHSLLSIMLRYDPPLNTIQHLTKLCSNAVFETDCIGQLPLHHALQNGASFQVIKHLLKLNVNGANVRNIFGCTPLHSLFDDSALAKISSNGHEENSYIIKMIDMFCAIKPSTMLINDMEERSILECVIENEFDYKSVNRVQRLTKYAISHKQVGN